MKKRMLSLALTLVMLISLLSVSSLAASLPFTDVPSGQWYYNDVKNAYEMNLINGKSATKFCPNDNLTYAEAVKLAACMHQRYQTGSVKLENGDPWYQSYVNYCLDNGIIAVDYNWNGNATRAGYMEIFANALPGSALKAINEIPDGSIPDVPMTHPQADAIYKLYRAGVLQGNDDARSCNPATYIRRSEVAAILTRMMDASKRIKFDMPTDTLILARQPEASYTGKEGQWITLEVEVTGGRAPYIYQWTYVNTKGLEYLADSSYTTGRETGTLKILFTKDNPMMGGTLRCEIGDQDLRHAETQKISLNLEQTAEPLHVTRQPASLSGTEGTFGTTEIAIGGGVKPYQFQWQYLSGGSWGNIGSYYTDNATAPTLKARFDPANAMVNGFRCVVTDQAGNTVTSETAYMTVEAAPELKIVRQPDDVYFYAPATEVELGVVISGGVAPYTYCWYITDCYGTDYVTMDVLYDSDYTFDTSDTTNIFVCNVTDSDFVASPNGFECCCIITDATGTSVTSNIGHIW